MTEFIRVRHADGPKHEFDISVPEVEANPELYVVVDAEPVTVAREATYADQPATKKVGDAKKPAPTAKAKAAQQAQSIPAAPPENPVGQQTDGQQ